ncbi:hypothetical protein FHETE_11312 [Fusarium heterosporum]|uniref:Ubiquitin-like protease family profile domain-containing protein n=1 Tax=Fusarium heterosporum TaxID=42747 RepID=A0A8H5SMU3_FUSHE|nr:hypothetical protein FHETE_11312 [Fusarium heterosporum]
MSGSTILCIASVPASLVVIATLGPTLCKCFPRQALTDIENQRIISSSEGPNQTASSSSYALNTLGDGLGGPEPAPPSQTPGTSTPTTIAVTHLPESAPPSQTPETSAESRKSAALIPPERCLFTQNPLRLGKTCPDQLVYINPILEFCREGQKVRINTAVKDEPISSKSEGMDTGETAPANVRDLSCSDDSDQSAPSDKHSMPDHDSARSRSIKSNTPARAISVQSDVGSTIDLERPVSKTTSRLRNDEKLKGNNISRFVALLKPSPEWHVFDAGYPFDQSVRTKELRASSLIFFVNVDDHWSLCHLDKENRQLNHYNSSYKTTMPTGGPKSWLQGQRAIGLTGRIIIKEEKRPQQEDKVNCGIFALVILQSLLSGGDISLQVNAKRLRVVFAAGLEDTSPLSKPTSAELPSLGRLASSDNQISLDRRKT